MYFIASAFKTAVLSMLFLLTIFISDVFAVTIIVNSDADNLSSGDGSCTLREAIANANDDASTYVDCLAGSGADEIVFDSTVAAVCLSHSDGSLNITDVLTIKGDESNNTVVDGGDTAAGGTTGCSASLGDRIFTVEFTAIVFQNLAIVNGNTGHYGGGIYADNSSVTLTDSMVSGNTAAINGGGLHARYSSSVTLIESTVSGNSAPYVSGGGIDAIYSSVVTLTDSTVSGNTAYYSGGGLYANGSTITLTNATVSGNTTSSGFGGGIDAGNAAVVTLTDSTVSGNTSYHAGGGISVSTSSSVTLTKSTVSGNTSSTSSGGGIYAYDLASVTLTDTTVSGNTANTSGGGIIAGDSSIVLTNSTVAENTASGDGGGIAIASASSAILTSSTVSANVSSGFGGGIDASGSSSISFKNSIVVANTAVSDGDDCYADSTSTPTSDGHNFVPTATCDYVPTTGDMTDGADLNLGTLAYNGGPTETMALGNGSVAIDTVGSGFCTVAADQRGAARDALCDTGAYEHGAVACGDDVVEGSEECDDGNVTHGDGCSEECLLEECGDGVINNSGAEECDDGNVRNRDGCSAACIVEYCGDSVVNNARSETCDDGNAMDGDGCSVSCDLEYCGDGIVNNSGAETCDDGNRVDNDGCTNLCQVDLPPTADAGKYSRFALGGRAWLFGVGYDPEGRRLIYLWTLTTAPAGSALTSSDITNQHQARTSLTPDVVGSYRFILTITDASGQSDSDSVAVTVY